MRFTRNQDQNTNTHPVDLWASSSCVGQPLVLGLIGKSLSLDFIGKPLVIGLIGKPLSWDFIGKLLFLNL